MTDTPDNPDSTITGDVIGTTVTSGEWLPPAAAATRLGISERTLWRHVTAGRYHKRTIAGRAEILVPGEASGAPDNHDTAIAPALPDNVSHLSVAIIEELRRQYDESAERLTRQAERVAALERENGRLEAEAEARAEALEWTDARRIQAEAQRDDLAEQLRTAEERARRPWWRKLTGR